MLNKTNNLSIPSNSARIPENNIPIGVARTIKLPDKDITRSKYFLSI